ncbi:hypothetical protein NPIL_414231 [Nephila pilipes]|uniref:Uncharacterized protein n=1 Tax=Nephila pilipes TaxID=299642 RepID=A0A8X6UJX1_NEPPI|nr:hypothetical protein NPIL_414231 [Nephila pilipes]
MDKTPLRKKKNDLHFTKKPLKEETYKSIKEKRRSYKSSNFLQYSKSNNFLYINLIQTCYRSGAMFLKGHVALLTQRNSMLPYGSSKPNDLVSEIEIGFKGRGMRDCMTTKRKRQTDPNTIFESIFIKQTVCFLDNFRPHLILMHIQKGILMYDLVEPFWGVMTSPKAKICI